MIVDISLQSILKAKYIWFITWYMEGETFAGRWTEMTLLWESSRRFYCIS